MLFQRSAVAALAVLCMSTSPAFGARESVTSIQQQDSVRDAIDNVRPYQVNEVSDPSSSTAHEQQETDEILDNLAPETTSDIPNQQEQEEPQEETSLVSEISDLPNQQQQDQQNDEIIDNLAPETSDIPNQQDQEQAENTNSNWAPETETNNQEQPKKFLSFAPEFDFDTPIKQEEIQNLPYRPYGRPQPTKNLDYDLIKLRERLSDWMREDPYESTYRISATTAPLIDAQTLYDQGYYTTMSLVTLKEPTTQYLPAGTNLISRKQIGRSTIEISTTLVEDAPAGSFTLKLSYNEAPGDEQLMCNTNIEIPSSNRRNLRTTLSQSIDTCIEQDTQLTLETPDRDQHAAEQTTFTALKAENSNIISLRELSDNAEFVREWVDRGENRDIPYLERGIYQKLYSFYGEQPDFANKMYDSLRMEKKPIHPLPSTSEGLSDEAAAHAAVESIVMLNILPELMLNLDYGVDAMCRGDIRAGQSYMDKAFALYEGQSDSIDNSLLFSQYMDNVAYKLHEAYSDKPVPYDVVVKSLINKKVKDHFIDMKGTVSDASLVADCGSVTLKKDQITELIANALYQHTLALAHIDGNKWDSMSEVEKDQVKAEATALAAIVAPLHDECELSCPAKAFGRVVSQELLDLLNLDNMSSALKPQTEKAEELINACTICTQRSQFSQTHLNIPKEGNEIKENIYSVIVNGVKMNAGEALPQQNTDNENSSNGL